MSVIDDEEGVTPEDMFDENEEDDYDIEEDEGIAEDDQRSLTFISNRKTKSIS